LGFHHPCGHGRWLKLIVPSTANSHYMPVLIHKEIYPRLMKTGEEFEKIHNATIDLEEEIRKHFDNEGYWHRTFHALNNSIIEMEKSQELANEDMHKRTKTIFEIFDIIKEDLPRLKELTHDTKAKIDAIYKFGDVLTEAAKQLIKVKNNLSESNRIMMELEKGCETQKENLTAIESRVRYLQASLEKQKKLYYRIVN
jgi:hypothetical protein